MLETNDSISSKIKIVILITKDICVSVIPRRCHNLTFVFYMGPFGLIRARMMSDFVTLLVFVISPSAGLGTRYWSHDEVCKCPLNTIHVFPFWNYCQTANVRYFINFSYIYSFKNSNRSVLHYSS